MRSSKSHSLPICFANPQEPTHRSRKEAVPVRKRYYIIFVAREDDGSLRKVPVPLHYAYVFVAAAVVGLFTITGMAGSYGRMLLKTAHYNQVRSEKETLRHDYLHMQ